VKYMGHTGNRVSYEADPVWLPGQKVLETAQSRSISGTSGYSNNIHIFISCVFDKDSLHRGLVIFVESIEKRLSPASNRRLIGMLGERMLT
jgi:hypothetical protein